MGIHNLIDKLGNDLTPVKILSPASYRALGLCLLSLVFITTVLHLLHGPRSDIVEALRHPSYLAEIVAMFFAGLLAALATFRLCVPDTKVRLPEKLMLCGAVGVWLFILFATLGQVVNNGFTMPDQGDKCLIGLSGMMVLPLALVIRMVTAGAPVWRGWVGFSMTLSISSFAATGMRIFCPNDTPEHLLFWHFIPVVIFALAGIILGKILLKSRLTKIWI